MVRAISFQPSPYPRLQFHIYRLSQLVCSIIVTSILSYFIHFLAAESFTIPWTFIILFTVSLLTIASYAATVFFYHRRSLKPTMSACINGFLSVIWLLGFALLFWNLRGTLTHRCHILNWGTDAGVMVCRLYKTLAAFTTIGMMSTVSTLLLDLRVRRNIAISGTYNAMQDVKMQNMNSPTAQSTENLNEPYQDRDLPVYLHEPKKAYRSQEMIEAQHFGYSAPSEQTAYDGAGGVELHGGYGNGHAI